MLRSAAVTSLLAVSCACALACEGVLGTVDVSSAPRGRAPAMPAEPEPVPPVAAPYPTPGELGGARPSAPPAALDAGALSSPDAAGGAPDAGADAAPAGEPPPPAPRPVLVDGPAAALELVGVEGGGPRLGVCEQGMLIGVRPSANPSTEVFGQRLTFVEPICATALADADGALHVTRDDSRLRWDATGDFLGEPSAEPPDERLLWVLQPEITCPPTAPVLVGLSGEYDPVAPDAADTVLISSLVIECAPIALAGDGVDVVALASGHQLIASVDGFAASGPEEYRSACEEGRVTTELLLHAGFWLDGFVLGCSSLRSPRGAGGACSAERDCQSGVCSPEGLCAP